MTLTRTYQVLSVLQQFDKYQNVKQMTKPDIEQILGLDSRNSSRYLNALEKEGLIKSWISTIEGTNKTMRFISLTAKGQKYELKEQVDLKDILELQQEKEIEPSQYICKKCKEPLTELNGNIYCSKCKKFKKPSEVIGPEIKTEAEIKEKQMKEYIKKIEPKEPSLKEISKQAVKELEAEKIQVIPKQKIPVIEYRKWKTSFGLIAQVIMELNKDAQKEILNSELKKLRGILTKRDKNSAWIFANINRFLTYAIEKELI